MASLSQSRALAGCRAFTTLRPRRAAKISNGGKVFMRRNDSYMIEVNVGEEEPEDIAIRRYMKAVMDSKVIDQLRAKKTRESKIEAYKRRLRERHEMRKAEFEWPTWEDVEGVDMSPKVFDEYFSLDPEGVFGMPGMGEEGDYLTAGEGLWGGYMDGNRAVPNGSTWDQGGYVDQGGYANAQQGQGFQGGYVNQAGGYINAGAGGYTDTQSGGYMNQSGGYMNQAGGYVNPAGGYDAYAQPGYANNGQFAVEGGVEPTYDSQGNFIYTAPQ